MYGRKKAHVWHSFVNDIGKEICYTVIVYKWISKLIICKNIKKGKKLSDSYPE